MQLLASPAAAIAFRLKEVDLESPSLQSTTRGPSESTSATMFPAVIYIVAFLTGAIVMSFEMLGSRYLNPYFGSGIYTWAALI